MGAQDRTVDETLARLAARTHGVVTRRALLSAGVTHRQIVRRVGRGSLIVVHRGVYRVGHAAPSMAARYLAAAWACGDGALLSGLAAAHVLGLIDGRAPVPEVTAPSERKVAGVRTRRCRAMGAEDRAVWNAIPVTTVPRTLVDLARSLSLAALVLACHNAGARHRITPGDVLRVVDRHPNARGRANLVRALTGDEPVSLSRLEQGFIRRLRAARLPLPEETNRYADEHRVDCRWVTRRLTVELDSYRFHNSRHSWQRDRDRERAAYARGDQHRRYTWQDVEEASAAMLRGLAAVLA